VGGSAEDTQLHEARRTISGHRLYDESAFERLEQIKILQAKNYTLIQIKKILEQQENPK
jgi:DNA-binding transcriptional MerR regulator